MKKQWWKKEVTSPEPCDCWFCWCYTYGTEFYQSYIKSFTPECSYLIENAKLIFLFRKKLAKKSPWSLFLRHPSRDPKIV